MSELNAGKTSTIHPVPGLEIPVKDKSLGALIAHNIKGIAIVVIFILAAAGAYATFAYVQKQNLLKAEDELGAILVNKQDEARLTALEELLKKAPEAAKDAIRLEIVKYASEAKDFKKAALVWSELSKSQDSGLKVIAELGKASALAQSGQDAEAVKVLKDLESSAPKIFALTVARQLAVTAEAAGVFKAALAGYQRMAELSKLQNMSYLNAKISELKTRIEKGESGKS